jgi:hypothetical protein
MTFKEWLESLKRPDSESYDDPGFDWELEYSGNIAAMEWAWNAALEAAAELERNRQSNDAVNFDELKSDEFSKR